MSKVMLDKKLHKKIINILGTDYTLFFTEKNTNQKLLDNTSDGICDMSDKVIYINDDYLYDDIHNKFTNNPEVYMKRCIRHEIIHAFLYESGLDVNSNSIEIWAKNEELIDWFAIQSPKINKVFKSIGVLE